MKELPSLSEVYGILVQEQIHQGIGRFEDVQVPAIRGNHPTVIIAKCKVTQ